MQSSQAMVVKRTFIEILQNDPTMLEADFLPLRSRVHSDPALYFKCQDADHEVETDIEFALAGLSSDSSDVESLRAHPRAGACTASAAATAAAAAPAEESAECAPSSGHASEASQELEGCTSQSSASSFDNLVASHLAEGDEESPWKGLASLLRENGRLALENKLLKEGARLAAENAALRDSMAGFADVPVVSAGQQVPLEPACAAFVPAQTSSKPALPPGMWLVPFSCSSPYDMNNCMAQGYQNKYPIWEGRQLSKAPATKQPTQQQQRGGKDAKVASLDADTPPTEGDTRTTVMLRNVPSNYSRDMVLDLINEKGFAGKYDFLYLPIDFRTQACLGYAFVNLAAPEDVAEFWRTFSGFADWVVPSKKVCRVTWSDPHQGRDAHVDRYRNSPVMHQSVPDKYKPLVFEAGERRPFPDPTKSPKAPRTRNYERVAAAEGGSGGAVEGVEAGDGSSGAVENVEDVACAGQ
mmetsp:Transcript_139163/g.444646  ORF Transcript_139163/g.444646 Transcript_139163/m.444646 type:complete len:469 (-) Transcript_139163:100-1506(-)